MNNIANTSARMILPIIFRFNFLQSMFVHSWNVIANLFTIIQKSFFILSYFVSPYLFRILCSGLIRYRYSQ